MGVCTLHQDVLDCVDGGRQGGCKHCVPHAPASKARCEGTLDEQDEEGEDNLPVEEGDDCEALKG